MSREKSFKADYIASLNEKQIGLYVFIIVLTILEIDSAKQ